MQRRCVAGAVYRPGEGWESGWLVHDGAHVVADGQGSPPQEPDVRGVILPAPVNAHTHVGDRVARGHDISGMSLAQVVAPPDGLKHRILRETSEEKLVLGMRAALDEALASGQRDVLDFREGGANGVSMLRRAAEGLPVRVVALARCGADWDDAEADDVLRAADGLGLSALADVPGDAPERAARAARRHGKRFALHFSEGKREDVGRALALAPDFLVHAVHATDDDLAAIAEKRTPIVLCPRSNALFGPLPDVATMMRLEIPLALGSDNAMFHELDVLLDARLLAQRFPEFARETWLDVAITGGAYVRDGAAPASFLRAGDPAEFLVLLPQGDHAADAVFGPLAPRHLRAPLTKG